jgi:hypothetical protein
MGTKCLQYGNHWLTQSLLTNVSSNWKMVKNQKSETYSIVSTLQYPLPWIGPYWDQSDCHILLLPIHMLVVILVSLSNCYLYHCYYCSWSHGFSYPWRWPYVIVGTRVLSYVDFGEISGDHEVPESYVSGAEILLRRTSSGIWKTLMVENPFPYLILLDSCCCLNASQR